MFMPIRRQERELSPADALAVVTAAEYGTLACMGVEYPHAVPLHYVYEQDAIYFHSATAGLKVELLDNNPRVCFSIVSHCKVLPAVFSTDYRSVIIYGQAEQVMTAPEKKRALALLVDKYAGDYKAESIPYIEQALAKVAIFKVVVERMTGKRGR